MAFRGLRVWGAVSAALHAAVLLLILLDLASRRFEEPREQAVAVELIAQLPAQEARGESPAPAPSPEPAAPSSPTPEPTAAEPPPPPPPAPPAPAQARAEPRPAPPPPPPEPAPPRPPQPPAVQAALPPPPPPSPPRPPQPAAQAPPAPQPPPTPPRPQQAAQATPPPRPVPPPPRAVPPPPEPARETPGTGQTPPVQRPQERSQSVLNALERLRQAQQQQAPSARPSPPQGVQQQASAAARPSAPQPPGGGAPTGTAALTAGERAGLADRISECWSVDGGGVGVRDIVVELRVVVDAGGTVRNVQPNGSVPGEPRARAVYEAARRALLDQRCNPLPLPRERLAALRDTVFRFNPRDLGFR